MRDALARALGVLALCLALAATSLQVHRPDCHLKLRSDCGACLAGSTTAWLDGPPNVPHDPLLAVAALEVETAATPRSADSPHVSGRAPPA